MWPGGHAVAIWWPAITTSGHSRWFSTFAHGMYEMTYRMSGSAMRQKSVQSIGSPLNMPGRSQPSGAVGGRLEEPRRVVRGGWRGPRPEAPRPMIATACT